MSRIVRKTGERIVDLFVPVKIRNVEVDCIVFRPVTLADVNRWNAGDFASVNALMAHLAGLSEDELGVVTYPDAQAMIDEFMIHLPAIMRNDIANGEIPVSRAIDHESEMAADDEAPATETDTPIQDGDINDPDYRDALIAMGMHPDKVEELRSQANGPGIDPGEKDDIAWQTGKADSG